MSLPDHKSFSPEDKNPLYEWVPTSTALGIIVEAGAKTRKRAKAIIEARGFYWFRVRSNDIHAIVPGSDEAAYFVHVDFVDHYMQCECKAFEHQPGACKHVLAALARALIEQEPGETDAAGWMRLAAEETRNTPAQYKPWEEEPSFDPEVAKKYDARVATRKKGRKEIECYVFDNDDGTETLWAGPLPLPKEGDMVTVYLPTGQKVPARIMSRTTSDYGFLGYWVQLGETPPGFEDDKMVAYGPEIYRNSSQIEREKERREEGEDDGG